MVSVNGYYTVAELESLHTVDYGLTPAAYTDGEVESSISMSEGYVNTYMGATYGSGVNTPETIKTVSMTIGIRLMHNRMVDGGIYTTLNSGKKYDIVFTQEDKELLDMYRDTVSIAIDVIPLYRSQYVG